MNFVLVRLEELAGGCCDHHYLGTFESTDLAREWLLRYGFFYGVVCLWRELIPGTGPFESLCLYGKKPRAIQRADVTDIEGFAILEFAS